MITLTRALLERCQHRPRRMGVCEMSDPQWQPISTAPKDATELRVQMAG